MAGKSPEKPPREEEPATGRPRTLAATPAEGPSSIPPTPVISPLLARRLGARVLDPETAVLAPGQPTPLPTVYVGDTLLVRDVRDPDIDANGRPTRVEELVEFAAKLPDPFLVEPVGEPMSLPARGEAADSLGPDGHVTVTRIRLSKDPSRAGRSPDAWRFMQTALMQTSERGALLYDKLGLGRLPEPDGEVDDAGKTAPGASGPARPQHGQRHQCRARAHRGRWRLGRHRRRLGRHRRRLGRHRRRLGRHRRRLGRHRRGLSPSTAAPASAVARLSSGRHPTRDWHRPGDRDAPVVAVLDTGLGQHPWFPDESAAKTAETCTDPGTCPGAHRRVTFAGKKIGVWAEPSRDPENTGVVFDDVNGLIDGLCGHGTFIAGIIRQRCPQAVILSVPVMASDGAALEDDIVGALTLLLDRHRAAKAAPDSIPHGVLDVLNLSIGYYHETPEEADDTALHDLLQEFVDEGVAVVAAAGNDSTRARFFPAAFAQPGPRGTRRGGSHQPG